MLTKVVTEDPALDNVRDDMKRHDDDRHEHV